MRRIDIPGVPTLQLNHLVLDLNGTISDRGELIDGVAQRLRLLAADFQLHLVTADTFGTASELAGRVGSSVTTIGSGADKAAFVRALSPEATVAIGNGRNDRRCCTPPGWGSRLSARRVRRPPRCWRRISSAAP